MTRLPLRALCTVLLSVCTVWLTGCASLMAPPGLGEAVPWRKLPGWSEERPAEAWPALLRGCEKLAAQPGWSPICAAALATVPPPDDATARDFFERHFTPHVLRGADRARDGLITGYYEPVLEGRLRPDERFRFPLYRRPDDMLIIDLAELVPELKGRKLRGRLEGRHVRPYYSRAEIHSHREPLAGYEIVWVDDPVSVALLQVQGSGRIRLEDGSEMAVGYADQNGHPYTSLGNVLIRRGALKAEEVNVPAIRAWLRANPEEVETVLSGNPSYVFFTVRDAAAASPLGSLGVPLTPERSIASDSKFITPGSAVWLTTRLPGETMDYRRLVFAQDTGGAIKGAVRADLFFGRGDAAGERAGIMKQPGRLFMLLPTAK